MYNYIKMCQSCGWLRAYDSNRDTFGVDKYVYCPICGKLLSKEGYSPDI